VQRVYQEGVSYDQSAVLVPHFRDGILQDIYYNIAYRPLIDEGQITGMIQVAIDVTQQVQSQKALTESQASLQSIIDLAELGSYSIDLSTNRMTKSTRTAQWYGLPQVTDVAASLNAIHESDRGWIGQVLADVLKPGSGGTFQVEYTVINQQNGHHRVLRTNGQVRWDPMGQPERIEGTVLDITSQRKLQVALEDQVQQRTEELAAANEELAAINEELTNNNEEYAAINEELEESNGLLIRSNDNLQRFAYVASHDLQEPLRKIQQFGDLLQNQYGPHLGDGINYLERMQAAASRMSTLIRDLLSFSRISTQRDSSAPVALNDIVDSVLITLELTIAETRAKVVVNDLPTISGDASQLRQLFQNLLSNALKFRQTGVAPVITVSTQVVAAFDLPPSVKPARSSRGYYRIDVADNGIGFDEKYLDRIFEVFQRLHGRNEFSGTGIGLAICEKVVTNHGGVITASSQPGQGATFSIYLPV
jgi:signal transduction histidine kinase